MELIKTVTKVSPTETILALPIGIPTPIKNRDIKAGNIKSTISRLRGKGYVIECTEEGRIDDVVVTLIRDPKH